MISHRIGKPYWTNMCISWDGNFGVCLMMFNGSNGNDMVIFNEHADLLGSGWENPEWLMITSCQKGHLYNHATSWGFVNGYNWETMVDSWIFMVCSGWIFVPIPFRVNPIGNPVLNQPRKKGTTEFGHQKKLQKRLGVFENDDRIQRCLNQLRWGYIWCFTMFHQPKKGDWTVSLFG